MEDLTVSQLRVLDLLARVHDLLSDEVEHNYRGPLARDHAANQVDRELEQALLDLVRSKR